MQALEMIERMVPGRLRQSARELVDAVFVGRSSRRGVAIAPQRLNRDYETGRWDYLSNLEEMTRYAVIGGYCRYDGTVSSVLDLGCGSGILRRWFSPLETIEYVGVDLSDCAIDIASRAWTDSRTKFVAMDAATYTPEHKFDMIIFNEVLYYFERPEDVLMRFADFLERDGSFLISLWDSADSRRAWQRSQGSVDVIDSVQIKHHSGVSWKIRLCRPRCRQHEVIDEAGLPYASSSLQN
ncbi:class I SAM-dependent methyltransferase [Bradyrhizobium sp. ISRA443]|uniref:class I SAM-dependent methyltransferase n=1 Tax=unclassified Bradyrhizobium TaxID=2631580 RepID=UPI00247B0A65|nr:MULTISPECIES: class I SAM-dependent methyltransferase [unclassified Bradyrhizobium]WGR96396.1 class I SAM-dependent methyltransferase [Bradyrhizobium sp. ISRA436]WGS03281.1 class I SAM-dependent methyltransferase [Bradyrhizobium sp. ISRA437]WGS10165.1 class I SAM-dependent methyltransferase [Bradyrhizobium sp. ISRA443]